MPLPTVLQPILQSDIVAAVAEFGDFEKVTGGGMQSNSTDHYPAGTKTPVKIPGTFSYKDITFSRAHNPLRDRPCIDWCERYLTGLDTSRSLMIKYLNRQGIVVTAETYTCHPINYDLPPGASGDNTLAEFSMTLAVEARIG